MIFLLLYLLLKQTELNPHQFWTEFACLYLVCFKLFFTEFFDALQEQSMTEWTLQNHILTQFDEREW